MKTLRERLAHPHCERFPLFPRSIEEMSHTEKEIELGECVRAWAINVWQSTTQMEEVKARRDALSKALEPPPAPYQNAELTRPAGFQLLK